ncbi:MAG TPA: hypothetical protein VFU47_16315 [Armatimonadota bacterium]|nr:hypothetical protein [Armatimonadota bacterium]
MTLQEFRKLVRKEFGGDLRYMTPANAREFLDRVQDEPLTARGRILLNEPEHTYEGIVRSYLSDALELPSDQAVIRLWLFCLELASSSVAEMEEEKFQKLFARLSSLDGD